MTFRDSETSAIIVPSLGHLPSSYIPGPWHFARDSRRALSGRRSPWCVLRRRRLRVAVCRDGGRVGTSVRCVLTIELVSAGHRPVVRGRTRGLREVERLLPCDQPGRSPVRGGDALRARQDAFPRRPNRGTRDSTLCAAAGGHAGSRLGGRHSQHPRRRVSPRGTPCADTVVAVAIAHRTTCVGDRVGGSLFSSRV